MNSQESVSFSSTLPSASVQNEGEATPNSFAAPPSLSLPKGGGAIKGMGETFAAHPVTGTGAMSVPIVLSPGRSGFSPQLSLSYDSGAGNGSFGMGWSLSLPAITRKTDQGLPRYWDDLESDVFIFAGAEDLVPILNEDGTIDEIAKAGYQIRRYRPRIEGLFARIERWTEIETGEIHWRTISRDNITTLYGKTTESRITAPDPAAHIFSWLICESYDDKGNAICYRYKAENSDGVDIAQAHERNRTPESRSTNRYLKRILYGNPTPRQPNEDLSLRSDWLFEAVLDYGEHDHGEHDLNQPQPNGAGSWGVRSDPFSSYRAGFEVRTYRLCQRVLMFHHFPDLPDGAAGYDGLVRSTDFTYSDEQNPSDARNPIYTFLRSVSQTGYQRQPEGGYIQKSLPPLEFFYSEAQIDETVREVDPLSLENLPEGLDGIRYQWIDLDGEGLTGILTEQGSGWFYQRNLSPLHRVHTNGTEDGTEAIQARFAPLERVERKPNVSLAAGAEFLDLAGDGQPDVVTLAGPAPGFYERTQDAGWSNFVELRSLPTLDWSNPNLKFIDLNGDGHADILITEDNCFVWHASQTEAGFGTAERVYQPWDEEKGARVVFADGTQSIYLADMSGDGLTDIVRIRNGEVCYWANLGYGRFGAKVTMDNAPWFDAPEQFNQQQILLADIDGSGTTDILYLGRDGVQIYFNQSGNGWSAQRLLANFPTIADRDVSVTAIDLLGNGTACLVWSSALPDSQRRSMRYVDLMGRQKPHLLIRTVNNLGGETIVQYAPSTQFYLQDQLAGKPWITRLPFPVQVVEQVEIRDLIDRRRFVTRYAYHHGYFDGEEREFRGFGMVEQQDTEAFEDYVVGVSHLDGTQELDPELYQPPVTTRTWFHTGAFLDRDRILHQLREEYYLQTQYVPEPTLPADLTAQELRECLRALKGLPLRHEVYSFDGSAQAEHPYSVMENTYTIQRLQPQGSQKHAVFFTTGRESVAINFDRHPTDPRISHRFNLEIDAYGNVQKSCAIVYGRKLTDPTLPPEVTRDQQTTYITCSETDYTAPIAQETPESVYRLPVPYESRSYEITGIQSVADRFQFAEIRDQIASAVPIAYEAIANNATPQKRLLSQSRILFRDNALNPLPLGEWDTLALGYESYRLALTPEVVTTHYAGKLSDPDFAAAGYVHFNGDANWWIPSGTAIYPANPANHFYLPIGTKDPLGTETIVTYDSYDFLIDRVHIVQASWNEMTAVNDYRVLSPIQITDPNQNRSAVEIDPLGMVVKSAAMGKAGAGEGDPLDDPTMRMEYELFNWINHRQPNFVHTLTREQHGAGNSRWQESYTYSNGSGGVALVKVQAHPGKALQVNLEGTVSEVDANPRWIGNGRTILNNKGNPVKQYESYFSTTHEYEAEKVLREIGVTPVIYYDAVGRSIRTRFPNGTFAKSEYTPWMQTAYDANDTVKESQWYLDRGSPDPVIQPEPVNDPERRAAWLAVKHTNTPGITYSDSLGRSTYAISDYGGGKTAAVRSESDLTGRFAKVFDQEQREVASQFVGMAGLPIRGESAEKGRRWMFVNVLGALVKTWDEQGREFRIEYDDLHRPVSTFVQEAGLTEILFSYVVYGDRHPNAIQRNLLGTAHQIFDQAGMVQVVEQDFKGNPKQVDRVLAKDYKTYLNWNSLAEQPDYGAIQAAANSALEISEVFSAYSQYDALNRPTQVVFPDGTIVQPTYNEANFLASLWAQIQGQGSFIEFLKDQDYDAKGQRQFAHYGNEVFTRYFYDPQTFQLTNLLTYRSSDNPDVNALQNLRYTYDPIGNITQIIDDAQQTHYFNNTVVKPESLYEYDAIYQLIRATGREHASLTNNAIRSSGDLDFMPQLPHSNQADAVRTYTEEYEYDRLGNLKVLRHRFQAQAGIGSGWTRHYRYAYEANAGDRTNRLIATSAPGDLEAGPYSATYRYDAYGNMTQMPHLAEMAWNFLDQLRQVDLGGGGKAYYVYGAGGQRIRKVIERNANTRIERIYLGTVEIYREWTNSIVRFERKTVHISDNTGRIAQVDIKTKDDDNRDPINPLDRQLIRYQYGNHLGSATLETNENGEVISYEEYHPYGTSAYRSAKPGFDLSLKRYRFSGKERDDETGLDYFGARYYAAWLGRWTSTDPAGFVDGANLFRYCSNNPINKIDLWGLDGITISGKPEEIQRAQRNPSQASGRIYETWVRAQTLSIDGQNYAVSGGTLTWSGDHWWIPDAELVPVTPSDGSSADSGASDGSGSGTDAGPAAEGAATPEVSQPDATSAPPPPTAPPTAPPASPPPEAASSSRDAASVGSPLSQASAGAERFIWQYPFRGQPGTFRGNILEWLYGIPWRDNTPGIDRVTDTAVQQVKSTNSYDEIGNITRSATRDAANHIAANPGTTAGRRPQAVVITPTDAPAAAVNEVNTALNPGRGRRIPPNALPPEHVRGLPGRVGAVGRGLTVGGTALSAYAFVDDVRRGDASMATGDALSTVGGGLEIYALASPGATVAGVSAMSAGLVLGGAGIAITSGISGYRSYQRGDTAGAIAGLVGVGAGLAIMAGVIFSAPALLVGGLVAAVGVGLFHLGRWLFS